MLKKFCNLVIDCEQSNHLSKDWFNCDKIEFDVIFLPSNIKLYQVDFMCFPKDFEVVILSFRLIARVCPYLGLYSKDF